MAAGKNDRSVLLKLRVMAGDYIPMHNFENSKKEYCEELKKLENDPEIQTLKGFTQHCCTTRFSHCRDVAVCSYRLARALHLNVDEKSLLRGAMLHDYYLYDTQSGEVSKFDHWMHHPEISLKNAEAVFDLNEKEKGIIRAHMWPINPVTAPNSVEGWLVCFADKYCAVKEVITMRVFKRDLESLQ